MPRNKEMKDAGLLLAGDVIVLALVTVSGFTTHGMLNTAGMRMLSTFLPLVIAWLLVGPHLGIYNSRYFYDPGYLWRPFWAMVLAGPMAAWLRGVWLNAPILPIFVVVLGGFSALGLLVWRSLYLFIGRRM